jgi:hypothetical protein
MMSEIMRIDDFGPCGFKWLTLKRITVSRHECPHQHCGSQMLSKIRANLHGQGLINDTLSTHSACVPVLLQYKDPHGRYRSFPPILQ